MSTVQSGLQYTETHEWVKVEGDVATIGIDDYAQEHLGEFVYVELPEVGDEISKGDEMGVVESVKSASDVYTPVSGEIIEINEALVDNPATLNESPYTEGWLFKIKLNNTSELEALLSAEDYEASIEE